MIGNAVKSNSKGKLFGAALFSVALIIVAGCKFNFHDDVYPSAGEKYRVIAPAVISPGTGTSLAFTRADVPTITITCADGGAVAHYSINGGTYQQYTGPFTLPVANYQADQTIVLSAYTTHSYYRQSDPVSQTYQFVATRIPTPSIDVAIPLYYHYDTPPTIQLSCALAGAQIHYSLNGGATYSLYTGSFPLPIPPADWTTNNSYTIMVYASTSGYLDSAPISATFPFLAEGTIITIAGNGNDGSSGDGGLATAAELFLPQGLYVDASGNVYIADCGNNRIRMVDTNGYITTIAGNGNGGYTGDGPATTTSVSQPMSLTFDETNRILYVFEQGSNCIRRIPLDGTDMTAFAGPLGTPITDGALRTSVSVSSIGGLSYYNSMLYITDYSSFTIWRVSTSGVSAFERVVGNGSSGAITDASPVTATSLVAPRGIVHDIGNTFYFIDGGSSGCIASFTPGGTVSVRRSTLEYPSRLCIVENSVYYFVSMSPSEALMRLDTSSGTVYPVSGPWSATETYSGDGGPASGANLNYPNGLFAVPGDGIYISDTSNNRVRKIILY
jgi:sugar lactone lactonase YvrE